MLAILLASSCAAKFKHSLDFNPAEPIRVAVLPFAQFDAAGNLAEQNPDLLIDNVPGISAKLKETPAEYLQKLVQTHFRDSSLDIISPALVTSQLLHSGYGRSDLSLDLQKILDADPRYLCDHVLQCDALLYGKVTKWERGYYALQSVHTVGLELKLVSARDGKILFAGEAEDSESRGITKGPTGFSDLLIAPISGLDSKITLDLAANIVDKMLAPFSTKNRPEFLATPPPEIFAAAFTPDNSRLNQNNALTVLVLGSNNKSASFSLGEKVRDIPMEEREPGHYLGEFFPLPTDRFENTPVFVFLTDQYGRTTKRQVGARTVSVGDN